MTSHERVTAGRADKKDQGSPKYISNSANSLLFVPNVRTT